MPSRIVFISCGPRQHESARAVARDLEVARYRAVVDTRLSGDEQWWRQRQEQIRDCDVFMPVLTRDFAESEICRRDAVHALALGKVLVAIRIAPLAATNDLAPELVGAPWIDYREDTRESAIRLVTAVNALPDPPPLPDPAPVPPHIPPFVVARIRSRIDSLVALGQKEQLDLLARIRALDDGERAAIPELLVRLRTRPDLLDPTVVEIDRILAEEPGA